MRHGQLRFERTERRPSRPAPRHQEPGDEKRPASTERDGVGNHLQTFCFFFSPEISISIYYIYICIYYRNRNRHIYVCIYIYVLIIIDDLPAMMRFHEVPAFFCSEWPASTCPRQDTCLVVTAVIAAVFAQRAEMALCEKRGWKKVCMGLSENRVYSQ